MFNNDKDVVEDVVSLRNQLRITEKSLQSLGVQLSLSENDSIILINDRSPSSHSPRRLTVEDLQKPDAVHTPPSNSFSEKQLSARAAVCEASETTRSCDCKARSGKDMDTEMFVLRRKLNAVREENSSLVLENRQLIGDLEATQLELASSKSKIRLLGSTVGAKSSSVAVLQEQMLGLEADLETQAKALQDAEQRLEENQEVTAQSEQLVERLREEMRALKVELSDRTRQGKRAEQQRNQALRNAEKLTVAFKDYKGDVTEKLKKVMESESLLKESLVECDREREELEKKCAELERAREGTSEEVRKLKEGCVRAEELALKRQELQEKVEQMTQQLSGLRKELALREGEVQEMPALRREGEDLRLLTACQEQRLAQAQREAEQGRAELASLEGILNLLHLREMRDGQLCVRPCLLPPLSCTGTTDSLLIHKPGYQQLLAVLQTMEQEKDRQAGSAQSLRERLGRTQEEVASLQASITQRSAHFQQLHNQLLDKAAQASGLEKELKKKNSRLVVLEKQLQEKSAAYSQAAMKTSQLEQELMEKTSSIQHCQSVLNKRQRDHQQALEKCREAHSERCRELHDKTETLHMALQQKTVEVEELQQTLSCAQRQTQEAQHQTLLLQASLEQLSQDSETKVKRGEELLRNFEEQTSESALKVRSLELELLSCQEELSGYLQKIEETKEQYERQLELKSSEARALQGELASRVLACRSSSEHNMELQDSLQRQQCMLQDGTARIVQLEESQSQLQTQVSQLEQELEKERSSLAEELRRREKEAEEASLEAQRKERQAAELSGSIVQLSSEMSKCRSELSDMELELLRLRRDSSAKASQLSQVKSALHETQGLLDRKSDMVTDLEEKLHRSEMDRRNSLQRAQLLEGQLEVVRGELADALDHLQELHDVLQKTQLTADQRQAAMDQLAAELRESQRELEERNHEVLDMDTALKERQGELQQRAQLLGHLDVEIKEHKLEMERKVDCLQEAVDKATRELKDRNKQVEFLTERLEVAQAQLQGKEDLEKGAVEQGEQLRVCREQLHDAMQGLQEAHTRCDTHTKHLDDLTQLVRQKEAQTQKLAEELAAVEQREAQGSAGLQATVTVLQQELEQQREEHHRELGVLQQTRGQLLKVSDQISSSLRNSQEQLAERLQLARLQLEEERSEAARLRTQLRAQEELLQSANEALLIKEAEIARLQARSSSYGRVSGLQHIAFQHPELTLPPLSPPNNDPVHRYCASPSSQHSSSLSSLGWPGATADCSVELSESLKANVQAALRRPESPALDWRGLSSHEATSTSELSFNPLTYMLDKEPEEEEQQQEQQEEQGPDQDSLSGMLRFVNQTLAMQEQRSKPGSSTHQQEHTLLPLPVSGASR